MLNPGAIDTGALTVYSYLSESYQPILAQIQRSAPGQILSAGNMTLNASGALINDKSRIIAGGTLGILGASLNNLGAFVSGNESHTGTSYNWGYAGHDGKSTGHHCDCDFYAFKGSAYNASLSVSLPALIGSAQQNLSPAIGSSVPGKIALASISSPGTVGSVAPVLTTPVSLTLPNNALYRQHPELGSRYLVETDPRFANYRTWLSSDYLLSALSLDPAVTQKRLGDGFYEQQLIREQIVQLTGRRLLDGYASDEAEYRALMNSGITFGQAWHLKPGIALSAAQMAQLTSDLVWLVETTVTLPDGSPQQVLVPQVYLMTRSGDLNANGSLIAGQTVIINVSGDVNNSGSLAGRDLLQLTADNIANLGGTLQADQVSLTATQNILNRGGRISAKDRLALAAGQDITLETTTASGSGQAANGRFSQTRRDRIAGLYVSGNSGSLSALAGRNLTLNAAEVLNAGSGTTQLVAGHDLTLGTITTRDQINIGGNDRNHAQVTASSEEGTRIRTQGDLTAIAGNDIAGRAVDIQAKGDVTLAAGNDVVLTAGRNEQSVDIASYDSGKKGGGLTSKTVTRNLQIQAATSTAREGQLAGKHLTIQAGQDIALEGGKYTAQEKLTLSAGRDLTLASAESAATHLQTLLVSTKENLGPGRQSLKTTRDEITVTPAVSQLNARDLTLQAGRDLTLVAPQIQTDTLTATAGNQLTIAAATATHELKETSEAKSNRFNFSEVTAPLRGTNGLRNALGLPDDQTFVTGGRIKDKIKLSQSESERRAVVAEINANDITLNSIGDTILVAPQIKAETLNIQAGTVNGKTINPQAKIQLLGVKESTTGSSSKNSHSFVHETVRDGGKSVETLKLPDIRLPDKTSATTPKLALTAPGGIVIGASALAPTQREQQANSNSSTKPASGTPYDLKAQAQSLAQQPGLAWLGEVAQLQDVDWQQIELATQQWDYKHAGLTKEGAAIVVIVVTALTWGTASSASAGLVADAGMTGATASAASAALAAGMTTLASQAAVSLINNQGDVGKTLQDLGSKDSIKQLVTSMLTAGLTQGVTQALQNANPLSPVSNPGFANRFATYATKAAVSAGVQSLVYGTPLSETAKTALINSLAQTLTSEIGDWGKSDTAYVAKTIAHAVVQCAAASIQNKDCGSAALGAAVAEVISPLLDQLDDRTKAAGYQQTLGSSIAGMGAMLVASLTGKDALTALNSAQMVDYYNRALHPAEAKRIEEIAGQYAEKRGISIDKAIAELTQQVEQNIDAAWDKRLGSDNQVAQAFLKENGLGQPLVDSATGQIYQLFTADAAQRDNHAQFAQYSKSDSLVRKELDLAMSKAYLPRDAQAINTPMTGSDMALNDAARDFANMKAQPASVQWSVLAELRGTRVVVMQQYAGLADELKNLPPTPDNAQRRTDLTMQLDRLEQRDAALLGATTPQRLDMGAAGSPNPINQRETYEGMGEALGLARLSGKGISSASINARIDLLKGAVAEAQAASAAEKAIASAKTEITIRRDDAQQYEHLKTTDGQNWDWQKQAPNSGAVPGSATTVTIQSGAVLDRYGYRKGEYMSPAGTPLEQRSLPPGKAADPYEAYEVLKPFKVTQEKIAPAFDQPGLGAQLRATIPEVQNRFANIDELIRFGYLKDPKVKP